MTELSTIRRLTFTLALAASVQHTVAEPADTSFLLAGLEELHVWGKRHDSRQAGYTSPSSVLTAADLVSINIATTEDIVKYEPSLVIRRRFIGDSNGTLGMRGSNMFQTPRSMVYADGVPLHYLLQSRWNGAPRWTMVSASEIAQVEVIYGPYSAEYSGNAMGGVVLIETAIPQQQESHADISYFSQSFDAYGFNDTLNGYKAFVSYGNKIGNLSVYFSFNHLDNESQPQSFYFGGNANNGTPVIGAIAGNDERSAPQLFFGDTGVIDTSTDNIKFKVGYGFGAWQTLLNIAYEDRNSLNSPNSYVRDAAGDTIWSGDVMQDGQAFSIPGSRLNVSDQERQSRSIGLRLKGRLTDNTSLQVNINQFDIAKDLSSSSARNPQDPAYTGAGQIIDLGDSGWHTAEAKFLINGLGNIDLVMGTRFERYELNTDVYASNNYLADSKDQLTNSSGGKTSLDALFAQFNWLLNDRWNITFGGRFEKWQSRNGYYADDDPATNELDIAYLPSRALDKFSPKFSTDYKVSDDWSLRYSLAKAYRFPIVEELFQQYAAFNSRNLSNPDFNPEDGLHHNFMIERNLNDGYLRVNIFRENIKDVIESQSIRLPSGLSFSTYVPVDEVQTTGVEFIVNADNLILQNLDMRFNLVYTNAEIVKNAVDPAIVGNQFTRMPEWRSNLLATYHLNDKWDLGSNLQYAADSFGRLDNTDNEDGVYDAQDGYTRIGLKANRTLGKHSKLSIGIDNITNGIAYVAHPWPGRTLYVSLAYDL